MPYLLAGSIAKRKPATLAIGYTDRGVHIGAVTVAAMGLLRRRYLCVMELARLFTLLRMRTRNAHRRNMGVLWELAHDVTPHTRAEYFSLLDRSIARMPIRLQ